MSQFYSKAELNRFKKYKKFYVSEGKTAEIAHQYAMDHIMLQRRLKSGQGSDIKVAR